MEACVGRMLKENLSARWDMLKQTSIKILKKKNAQMRRKKTEVFVWQKADAQTWNCITSWSTYFHTVCRCHVTCAPLPQTTSGSFSRHGKPGALRVPCASEAGTRKCWAVLFKKICLRCHLDMTRLWKSFGRYFHTATLKKYTLRSPKCRFISQKRYLGKIGLKSH